MYQIYKINTIILYIIYHLLLTLFTINQHCTPYDRQQASAPTAIKQRSINTSECDRQSDTIDYDHAISQRSQRSMDSPIRINGTHATHPTIDLTSTTTPTQQSSVEQHPSNPASHPTPGRSHPTQPSSVMCSSSNLASHSTAARPYPMICSCRTQCINLLFTIRYLLLYCII